MNLQHQRIAALCEQLKMACLATELRNSAHVDTLFGIVDAACTATPGSPSCVTTTRPDIQTR